MVSLRPQKLPLLIGLVSIAAALPAQAAVTWRTDLNAAVQEARRTSKPMLVDFYTDWCGWCKRLDKDVYPDPTVSRLSKQFVMVKLNAEGTGAAAARQAGVTGFPTLLFMDGQGNRLLTIPGYVPAPTLSQAMQRVLASRPAKAPAVSAKTSGKTEAVPRAGATKAPAGKKAGGGQPQGGQWQGAQGIYLLDESGAVQLDKTVKPKASAAGQGRPALPRPAHGQNNPPIPQAAFGPGQNAAPGQTGTSPHPTPTPPPSGLSISPTGVLTVQ